MWRFLLRKLGFEQTLHTPGDPGDQLFRRSLLLLHRLHAMELRRWDARNASIALIKVAGHGPDDILDVDLPPWWHEADAILREAGWDVEA